MSMISMFFVHTASVETLAGSGAYGDVYAAPVTVPCFADDGNHLVRATTGEEVVSSTAIYAPIANQSAFTVNTRVTVNGRVATVISVNARTSGALGLPDHVEVHLT
jgi:hypothetical protein